MLGSDSNKGLCNFSGPSVQKTSLLKKQFHFSAIVNLRI